MAHAVETRFERSDDIHPLRDVPDDAHAAAVGLDGNRLHEVRIHARVDLHFETSRLFQSIENGDDVAIRFDDDRAHRFGPVAIDKTVDEDARAEPFAGVDRITDPGDELENV